MKNSVTAERGAAFLDERAPGWAECIDLDSFDLESSCGCVVAQVYAARHPRARIRPWERFSCGLKDLGITDHEARRLGFIAADKGPVGRTWRRLISKRQTARAA